MHGQTQANVIVCAIIIFSLTSYVIIYFRTIFPTDIPRPFLCNNISEISSYCWCSFWSGLVSTPLQNVTRGSPSNLSPI